MKKGLQYIVSLTIILTLISSLSGINIKYHHCNMMHKTDLSIMTSNDNDARQSCSMQMSNKTNCDIDNNNVNRPQYTHHCCDIKNLILLTNFDLINHSDNIKFYPNSNQPVFINTLFSINSSTNDIFQKEYANEIVHRIYGALYLQLISQMRA